MTLERIEHKVFASEAPLDEMGQFGSALTTTKLNTKDVAEIQALPAYTKGWGSAIISENNYPAMEEMNGVLNVMSYHTGYLYQEGIPTYSANQTYSATSWVKDLAGEKIYKSLQNENVGHSLTDTSWWQEVFGNSVYVKKSGDTMTGDLIINKNGGHFRISGTDWKGLAGSNPEADITATNQTDKQGTRVISYDKNGAIMGYLQTFIDKNGAVVTSINAQRKINSELLQSSITVGVDTQGNKYTNAITPPEDNKSVKIATTEWVRKQASKDGFPSSRYIELTLQENTQDDNGFHVSQHTAPANGWFAILWGCNGKDDYFMMKNHKKWYRHQTPNNGFSGYHACILPFVKDDICHISYIKKPTSCQLRFIYAEGN